MVRKLVIVILFVCVGITSSVLANSQGFPFPGNKDSAVEQAPTRYFVKYREGKEHEVRALLNQYDLELVDELPNDQVFVVEGELERINMLNQNSLIEYTEQEPIRKLLGQ